MESFWRIVGNSHSTGDTQLVVFDLEKQEALISYSRTTDQKTEDKEACQFCAYTEICGR